MTTYARNLALTMLKADLEYNRTDKDAYFNQLIDAAVAFITGEGVTLDIEDESPAPDHIAVIVMYAAYLYRKRKGDNVPMPRMIRFELNKLLISQKGKPDETE